MVLHIVNLSDKSVPFNVEVKGFGSPSQIKEISLSGGLKDVNSPFQPRKIAPVERQLRTLDEAVAKPYSYTILEVRK